MQTEVTPLLPKTIEMRALAYMEQGIEPIEAVKKAFEDEENLIWFVKDGIDMKTGRMYRDAHKEFISAMCTRVYNRINNK